MDPVHSLQDVIRCHNCEIPVPTKHCDTCHEHLCENCVAEHCSNQSKKHCIVQFESRGSTMFNLQDVIRCHRCKNSLPSKHCDVCHVHLCNACEEQHLSDEPEEHIVVPFNMRGSSPKCVNHSSKMCVLHCGYCDVPICAECVSSGKHDQHQRETILKSLSLNKELMQIDLKELEESIYPSYKEVASTIPAQRADVSRRFTILKISLNDKAQTLHEDIDTIIDIQKMQTDIDAMTSELLAAIDKEETVINETVKEISHVILEVRKSLDTNNVYLVSTYQSRNHKFKTLPAQLQFTLPSFTPTKNYTEQISKQIGSLSELAIAWLPISTTFLDRPQILADINVREHGVFNPLRGISRFTDTEFLTRQNDNMIRLCNLKGDLIRSIQTKSGNMPWGIAVSRSGDLMYTDCHDRSINLVIGTQIQTLIKLQGWLPICLCSTYAGDLLVIMISKDGKETKVVRYSGSTEKQTIQWDDQGMPLYTSAYISNKYLAENRNFDICVTDNNVVVVVNAAGKLRFRYTGPRSTTRKSFEPFGITTDSRANFLIADRRNNRIHIIDRNGNFLRYIDNCGLHHPIDLCVDTSDNLFIAEAKEGKVKKIKYHKK